MTKPLLRITVCTAALLLAAGCSGYNKLLKSNDKERMYQAAFEYFEAGKYDKTLQLFEEIAPYYQGTAREDTILFYTADAHYRSRDYQLSSMEFDDFRNRFGRSPFVEEAEYKYAMGFYYLSPQPNRDQTSTYMAITSINEYLQRYPNSLKKQLCLLRLDELQQTLYDKSFFNARTYYKIGRHKSAVIALRNPAPGGDPLPHRQVVLRTGHQLGGIDATRPLPRHAGCLLHVRGRFSGEPLPPRARPASESREGIPRHTPDRSNRIRNKHTMDIKKNNVPNNTVTRKLTDLDSPTGNIYESLVVISRRANQIATQELNRKLADFSTTTDTLEETFENREQIEISRYYERLPKPTLIATEEFLEGEVYFRNATPDSEQQQ